MVQINDEIHGKLTPRVIVHVNSGSSNRTVEEESYRRNQLKVETLATTVTGIAEVTVVMDTSLMPVFKETDLQLMIRLLFLPTNSLELKAKLAGSLLLTELIMQIRMVL